MHPVEQTEIIGVLGDIGEKVGNPQAALTVLAEIPGRSEEFFATILALLATVPGQLRFVVEGIDVGRCAPHREVDDVFRPWLEVGIFCRQRTARCGRGTFGGKGAESDPSETGRKGSESAAAGEIVLEHDRGGSKIEVGDFSE